MGKKTFRHTKTNYSCQEELKKIFYLIRQKFYLSIREESEKIDFNCCRKIVKYYEEFCEFNGEKNQGYLMDLIFFCSEGIREKKEKKFFKKVCTLGIMNLNQ